MLDWTEERWAATG